MYGSSGDGDKNKSVRGSSMGNDYWWAKRTDPALDLASNLYLDSDITW